VTKPSIALGCAAIVATLAFAARAEGSGDAQRGAQVFLQCKACHSLEPGKNAIGPSLHGLFGRNAGTVPGYNYSPAMKNSGIVWNNDTLAGYLADPKKVVPGDKMPFLGVKNPTQLSDLLAYLQQATR
jgi:cytochrome c2